MSTSESFVEHVLELVRFGDRLTARKMFGEYALYLDQKVVALACDDSLFVKQLAATAALTNELPFGPPYPGARPFAVADILLDDPERLAALLEQTAAALPPSRPRVRKGSRKKRG